jgi:DNA repair protein RecO (recombination protein O)
MTKAELLNNQYELPKQKLLSGFYLNELLYKLLHHYDSHPKIFALYENTLKKLSNGENSEICLRIFDKYLLRELGYELPLDKDVDGHDIKPENYYIYKHEKGFVKVDNREQNSISGISLLTWHFENFATQSNKQIIKEIENIANYIFNHLLTSPLQTAKII